ncbi:OmpA family protein [Pelomonas sp. V22]|uniref:OmpA family protein n=1 Tax=Pelomonas sp. V22 TaxID=2822139 RepID=UPI0024A8E9CA|nr:OmpA family protein [Pelomonas sp. V22]MDI4631427.1 OmpA family protein [Pelomonas sp. V22]
MARAVPEPEPPLLVPLVAGLRVTTAVHESGAGDYESTKTLLGRLPAPLQGWRIELQATRRHPNGGPAPHPSRSLRLQLDTDLASATTYRPRFEDDAEEDYPGTTALGPSTRVLAALRTGRSTLRIVEDPAAFMPGAPDPLGLGALFAAGEVVLSGELLRQAAPPPRAVLLRGRPQTLPVLRAAGELRTRSGHSVPVQLDVLDDARNPIALGWRIGVHELAVVRIDWPAPDDAARLTAALDRERRVVLPGLSFDFRSAVLRSDCAAALDTLVAALQAARPSATWRLEGHTDNIGSDEANLALSKARAQAVQAALTQRNARLGSRLRTVGFGASRPVDSNATLQGRARNRRVELVLEAE